MYDGPGVGPSPTYTFVVALNPLYDIVTGTDAPAVVNVDGDQVYCDCVRISSELSSYSATTTMPVGSKDSPTVYEVLSGVTSTEMPIRVGGDGASETDTLNVALIVLGVE